MSRPPADPTLPDPEVGPESGRSGVGALVEAQGSRVHAVAQTGRARSVREDVTQVGAAILAPRLGPDHAVGVVNVLFDGVTLDRLEEARPSGSGLELRLRREQRRVATNAYVGAVVVAVPILAREGPLGAGLAGHLELGLGQVLTPLGVGLGELVVRGCGHSISSSISSGSISSGSISSGGISSGNSGIGVPNARASRRVP